MPVYSYVALKNNKEIIKGKIDAYNIKHAREQLRQLGYLPTKITDESQGKGSEAKTTTAKLPNLSLKEKLDFTTTFHTLDLAGVPVNDSFIFMEYDASSRRIRLLAREIRKQIIAGSTFLIP
jgi:type IV pilus assembly protein PilC